jgi:hypothetical protein
MAENKSLFTPYMFEPWVETENHDEDHDDDDDDGCGGRGGNDDDLKRWKTAWDSTLPLLLVIIPAIFTKASTWRIRVSGASSLVL